MKKELKDLLRARRRDALPAVLIAAAECVPLSKTGGLADITGALPKALRSLGLEARVITPFHRMTRERFAGQTEHLFHFYVNLGWRRQYVGIERLELDGTVFYLVDNEQHFGGAIYRGGEAEIEQYAFFTRALLEALPRLDFQPEILHCNDWHTAMLPVLLRTQYGDAPQGRLKTLLTIHNIAFQGRCSFGFVQDLLGVDAQYLTPEYLALDGAACFLKGGLVFADRINTVSPGYARELMMPYYAEGLEDVLNARQADVSGILNGIDRELYNPRTDPLLPAHFDRGHRRGKARCKAALQEKMGLERRADVPLVAMVTRMTEQKGFDLVSCVLDDLMSREDLQFALIGSGDARFENFMRQAQERYPGRLCAWIGYCEELSRLVYAGSDFFLMPSRFEPCGLSQMIAMRYGSLPIVRETGGLRDTVRPYNGQTGEGNGFGFVNFDAWEMREAICTALNCYTDPAVMDRLINSAMQADFGLEQTALEYARLYLCML